MGKEILLPETLEELVKLTAQELASGIVAERKANADQQEELLQTISELKSELVASKKGGAVQNTVVTHEKRKFEVTIPSFRWKGKVIKAIELKGFPEIIAEILSDEGQTLLVEVKK